MEEKVYRAGLIGAGMIAKVHMRNLQRTGRVELKWIAARDPENLEQVRREFQIPHSTRDYRDILSDPEVDMLIITTPPHLHKEMFIACLQAGKHVLLEKPMAMNMEEIDAMMEVRKRYPDLVAMECSGRHSRLIPKYRKLREIIDSGALGEIYAIHHNSVSRQGRPGIEYHPTAKWFLNKAMAGGGPLFDWGVYDLSFHLGILGDRHELLAIESIVMKSGLDSVDPGCDIYDVEEHFMLNLRLTDQVNYYWERGAHANVEVPNETRVYGSRGGVRLGYNSWDDPQIRFYSLDGDNRAVREVLDLDYAQHDDGFALSEHFVHVLDGSEEAIISLELARKHLEIIFKVYAKAKDLKL